MSSPPGRPPQPKPTTTNTIVANSVDNTTSTSKARGLYRKPIYRTTHTSSTRAALAHRSPRNSNEGDSEAETDVLPEATTATPTIKSDAPRRSSVAESSEAAEYERGRGRRASQGAERKRARGIDADAEADESDSRGRGVANERKIRGRPPKRRAQGLDPEDDSSDLTSVPSPSSRAGSPPSYLVHPHHPHHGRHHRRRAKQQNGRLRKRKLLGSGGVGSDVAPGVVADSSGFDAENSDDDTRHGRPRRRKRRRSLPPDSSPPPRLVIKSSPQVSPHPLSPLKSNTRTTEKVHASQRTLKQRKLPPPLNTSREKNSSDEALSSSPSFRDRSPSSSSRHPRRHQSTVRTPGSPVSMSHKPRRDTAGRTHLHRACQRGAVSEVETILNLGKEFLNEEDNAGYMPLHEACLYGHLDVVKVLLDNGAWLDVPSRIELDTPLLDAVDNGHADVVKYLLELGADPRKRNKQGQTALDANDSNRDFPEKFREIEDLLKVAINKLRSKRSSDDENPRASAPADSHSSRDPSVASPVHQSPHPTPLPTAARRRGARTEQSRKDLLWLDAGKNGLQKLRELAREGDQQLVHALLERGTKPDAESLIGAIKGGHTDTVSLLLAYNNSIVDPDPGNYSRGGNRKNRDTSTPAGEETPMLAAIGRGNLEVLRYLLENGVNPRRLDYRGKSYAEIAKEREGEFWPEEVDMLKKAWDKAGCGGSVKARNPSFSHKGSSPKPKKSTTEGKQAPSNPRRPSSNPSTSFPNQSTNLPRHSSPVNTSKYDSTAALSDRESTTAEPLGPPRPQRNAKRTESEISTPVIKKKRRLVSGKDLEEESLARGGDASGRPADRSARRARPSTGDPKPEPRPSVNATPAARGAHTPRPDRIDSSQPKPESGVRDKKPALPKRERTRSPASRSEESRKSELEENKRGRRFLNRVEEPLPPSHKKKPENDSSATRPKEGGATKNMNVKRKMHPNEAAMRKDTDNQARRLSRDEAPSDRTLQHQRDERARRKTKDIADARRGKERPDRGGGGLERRVKSKDEVEKRRVSVELEAKERNRQNHLIKEMVSIQNKAQDESKAARTDEILTRELERRKHTEAERAEREAKEREEKEAREKEEEERIAREVREKEAREAKEREIREREAREREAEEKRLAEIKRVEEEKKRLEEERRREEARILEEQRQEAERKRLELLEQQRLEEIERKRKAAEEDERKRQELERAQREKEARDREIAEELQRRLEAERKRQEEEAAEKRRKEEEEEEARKREIARKEALPYALRQAEEESGVTLDRSKFLPLYSATFSSGSTQSSPTMTTPVKPDSGNGVVQVNGVGPVKSYKWILNVQAALVLGVTDLSFSTYGDIKPRFVTDHERFRMWSVLSVMLCESAYQSDRPIEELENARREERNKFLRMSPVFWIKFDDFIDIINADPRYSPLAASRPRTIDVDTAFFGVSNNTPTKSGANGSSIPATPVSTSKEEMALRLSKLFGTPPPAQPPLASPQPSPSMPPPPAGGGTTPVISPGEST